MELASQQWHRTNGNRLHARYICQLIAGGKRLRLSSLHFQCSANNNTEIQWNKRFYFDCWATTYNDEFNCKFVNYFFLYLSENFCLKSAVFPQLMAQYPYQVWFLQLLVFKGTWIYLCGCWLMVFTTACLVFQSNECLRNLFWMSKRTMLSFELSEKVH